MNLVEMVHQSVQKHGDKECIRYKRDGAYCSLTYSQFWDEVMHFAAGLIDCGVRPGDKVGLLATNRPEWAVSDCAILAIGAVVVPVYPTLPADQISFILHNADITCMVLEDDPQLHKVAEIWPEQLRGAIVMSPSSAREPEQLIGRWILPFASVSARGAQILHKTPIPFDEIPDHHLATIVHTSGTSGRPKGVMLSHRNVVSNVTASLSYIPVKPDDISLSYLPLSHVFERTIGQFAALHSGAAIAYAERIETIPQNLLEVQPTFLITVPRLLEKVYTGIQAKLEHAPKPLRAILNRGMNQPSRRGIAYRLVDLLVYRKIRRGLGGRMRLIASGGAALAPHIAKFYEKAGIPVHEGYGMTESSPVISTNPLGENRIGTVGRVIPGVEVKLAEDGELLVRGPNVMQGYYGDEAETARTIVDGWLHTGDIAEISDGYVKIVDRKKNIMVLATGKNVAPAPIENAVALSPYISSAVLVGDGRKYVTCVLAPDIQSLQVLVKSIGLPDDNPETWIKHPEVRKRIAQEVSRLTASFAPFERPKRAILLAHELTLEDGDLTPTLKVRTRVLMEKYGPTIEAMYAGKDYIPIGHDHEDDHEGITPPPVVPILLPGAAPHQLQQGTASSGATVETESGSAPLSRIRYKRRRFIWMAAAGILVLCLGSISALAAHHSLPSNLNVLGNILHIHKNNQKINNENGQIVGNLQNINQLAGNTATIGNNLHTLKSGSQADQQLLLALNVLSQQEVNLSQNFYSLAQTLQRDMGGISNGASTQDQTVAGMIKQAIRLHATASQLVQANQSVARKLADADQKAHIIAAEMP